LVLRLVQAMLTAHGFTPLFIAAGKGHLECLRLLLESGADKEAKHTTGATPLFAAVENGHLECARLLLESGADRHVELSDGTTPLLCAGHTGRHEFVLLLTNLDGCMDDRPDLGSKPSDNSMAAPMDQVPRHFP
jgi:ankyrin repeat protein